jgi:hypothetical protein
MLRPFSKSLFASAVLAAALHASLLLAQTKVQGSVSNGTTDRPVANQAIRLLNPRAGAQVATAASDGAGHFAFTSGEIDPKSFYLVTTEYQGVSYNAPASFDSNGNADVKLTIYDSTHSPAGIRIPAMRMLIGAEGQELRIQEEYAIQNSNDPPRAYTAAAGTFKFHIPADANQANVSVTGVMNMPLPQTPQPGSKPGEFSIGYPLKPGVTMLTLQYTRPYSASAEIHDGASFPIDQAELYVYPSSLSVSATGFQPTRVDTTHEVQVFGAPQFPANTMALAIRLSGAAAAGPPPNMEQGGAGQGQGGGQDQGAAQDQVKIIPNSISTVGAPILAGFLLLLFWALGVRVLKDWHRLKARIAAEGSAPPLDAKVEKLLTSMADLDELFAGKKIPESKYWKERLELKARLVTLLKKNPPAGLESYAARPQPR